MFHFKVLLFVVFVGSALSLIIFCLLNPKFSSYKIFIRKTPRPKNPWEKYFHSTMNVVQRKKMMELLNVFQKQMDKFNITYLLYGGSLIGAHRHHGMIPWDDDIDLLVDSTKKETLKVALKELNETHKLKDYEGKETEKWKFYKLDGQPFQHKPFRYPYLDLFFLKKYNNSMFYVEVVNEYIPKDQLFPLIDKFFDGFLIPAPCDTENILKNYYKNLSRCVSPSWNHSTEYYVPRELQLAIHCNALKPFFPFVNRKMNNQKKVEEFLIDDNEVIQKIKYSLPPKCSGNISNYNPKLSVVKYSINY